MPLIKHDHIQASTQTKHLGKLLGQEIVAEESFIEPGHEPARGLSEAEYQQQLNDLVQRAQVEGQSIKSTAEQEARRIIDAARSEAAQILEEERGKGFELGRAEAFKQLAENIKEAQQVIEQAKQQRNAIIKAAVPEILKLSMKVSAQVIKTELTSNQDIVMTILRDAIEKISDNEQVVIKVSQHDLQHVRNNRDLIIDLVEAKNLSIVADKHVNDGGCVIETKLGYIDAKVSTKLEMIENALLSIYEEDKVKRETLLKEAIERGEVADPSRDEDLEEMVAAAEQAEQIQPIQPEAAPPDTVL
jgi:flagellar biosynthesis/type III secretory pathway protein FliH